MEIEEEQSPPQHQQRRPGSKAAPMAAWLVEARDGSLSLSEDALAFAIAEWRMSGATKSARIHLVHVLTHISVDRDMMRLPISEVSPMTADTHEKNMRAMLLDPLVKFALKNEADVDIIVVRNDDRKAGMLEIAKQLSPHRVFVSAKPSMFGKRSAIAIIEALSGPFFAAHLPDNARLVALQGKKVLKDITIGSPGSCAASPVVELARGNAAARDAHYLSAPQTPPRGFLSPAGSRKFSPPAEREQRADSTSPPASSASANGAAAATSSSSGSAKLSAKLTSFWRTSSQDLSGSQSGPQRSESLGSPPRSLKSASPADSNRSFKQQSQPRPPSPGYFDASHSSKWGEKASQGGKKAPMKPGIVVDGRGGAEAHGQGGADADGLEVTLVEGETPRSRGGVRGGASMPFRRCSEEGKAADAGHADASDGPFDGRSSTTGSLVATRPPHRNALPSLPSISSQPGCLHLDAGTVAGATGNFSDRLCLMPRHPLVRAYNGYMGGIQIVAAQMSGPDWLSGPADPESASSAPSPFEAAAQRFIAPLEHAHICPLLGCSPSLRCLVYPRPPGSTSLATRLACCGAGGGGSGGAMSRTSSSGSLVHRSSSAGSFNSPDSSTSERFVEGSAGNGPVGTRSLGGGSLRPLSWQTRLKIVTQTCRALTWLHQQSPPIAAGCLGVETVLLTRDDSCKLLLAGVAALAADPGKMSEKLNREMGMEGYICLAEDGGERKGREGLGVGWNEGGKEIGKGQSGGAEAGDVFALGLLMLHLLTGWVDGGAVRQLLAACWAAADIHRAVEVVARAARQSCQMQPCCDWPDGVLYSLAMVALECAEECQEWRPVLVGCVMDQVLEIEADAQEGLTRRDGGKKKKGQQCACWGTSGDAEEWGEEEEGAAVRVLRHEWRVLRFNESTRQSVARVATVAVDTPLLSPIRLAPSLSPCPHGLDLKPQVQGSSSGPHQHVLNISALLLCSAFPPPFSPPLLCFPTPLLSPTALASHPPPCPYGADLKSMAAAAFTSCHLHHPPSSASHSTRILCLGLGGGSLPLFLAHALPFAHVDAVEIDPAVIAAATRHMGFPAWAVRPAADSHSGLKAQAEAEGEASLVGVTPMAGGQKAGVTVASDATAEAERVVWQGLYGRVAVYNEDAVSFVLRAAERIGRGGGDGESGRRGEGESADAGDREEQQEPYDLVLVDVFDGSDETPPELLDRDGPFLRALAQLVHPRHGTVVVSVMNVHADVPPPSLWERVTGRFGDGWADESTQRGRRIHKICRAYSSSLLPPSGIAFTTTTPSQGNMTLEVQRGVVLGEMARERESGCHLRERRSVLRRLKTPFSPSAPVSLSRLPPYSSSLLHPAETHTARQSGIALTTTTPSQGNMTLVVQRGVVLEGGGGNRQAELEGRLKEAAAAVEEEGAVPFTVAPRVVRGLKAELEGRLKEAAAAVEEGGAVPFTVAPRVVRGLKVFPVEWWCC
ncbi:unnamed protein product [Closterium sp. NIES-64]|nr:unnamed protein product [Closterium sp. NIES-64]